MTPSTLTCCSCRTAISVPTAARLLICQGCGAQLEVVHGEGASYTTVPDPSAVEDGRLSSRDNGERAVSTRWGRLLVISVGLVAAGAVAIGVLAGNAQVAILVATGGLVWGLIAFVVFQIAGPLGRKYRQVRRRMEGVDGPGRVDEVNP